ncbi:MAG TPA: FKBP-type peptidyl-prolyl cis-trans isomerase [Rubricoccaceae bacterium]|jgi:FKBP-type peptidyl-prolyl cis-trans isomerase
MTLRLAASILALAFVAAGCDSTDPLTPVTCADAPLSVQDISVTTSQAANQGSFVSVRYVGRLTNGAAFDSTRAGAVASFSLQQVVTGFRLGIGGTDAFPEAQVPEIAPMRLGSRRIITIPPNLGYGGVPLTDQNGNVILNSAGTPLIPACSTLIFDVTLVDID